MAVKAQRVTNTTAASASPAEEYSVSGFIERVIFRRDEYVVLAVKPRRTADLKGTPGEYDVYGSPARTFRACGSLGQANTSVEHEFTGRWERHPQYGPQFAFSMAVAKPPSDTDGMIRFLASLATGVGPVTAEKILDTVGGEEGRDFAVEYLLDCPTCIYTVEFLTVEQKEQIYYGLTQNELKAQLAALICGDGVSIRTVERILAVYGKLALDVVKEDPYVLARDVWGIGFKKADHIAMSKLGVSPKSQQRITAAIDYAITQAHNQGHVFLTKSQVLNCLPTLLGPNIVTNDSVNKGVEALAKDGMAVTEDGAVYNSHLYEYECMLADRLIALIKARFTSLPVTEDMIDKYERELQNNLAHFDCYAPEQRKAIMTAFQHRVSIVTGGPGTGKSTVMRTICDIYHELYPTDEILLCAPTGRAAKRLQETTGIPAATIHRLLGYTSGGFTYDRYTPLPGPALVIIDEASMNDVWLSAHLFDAICKHHMVVVVGDVDQLPSVGPGNVLHDMIASGQFPVTRLRFNYRQAAGSKIAEYANVIIGGRMPPLGYEGDWYCRCTPTADAAAQMVDEWLRAAKEKGLTSMEVQILTPRIDGSCGVKTLNKIARQYWNPLGEHNAVSVEGFRQGDKVMNTKNNYDQDIMNGDIGRVTEVDPRNSTVTVDFPDVGVRTLRKDELLHLQLAYAATIHKAQGSEFPYVIMPITMQAYTLLYRNLIYTGITRAKTKLLLTGEQRAIKRAVQNSVVQRRNSRLAQRLRGEYSHDGHDGPDYTPEVAAGRGRTDTLTDALDKAFAALEEKW